MPKSVAKTISKFPKEDKERIQDILRSFELDPWQGDIAKIQGENDSWRRRSGNYRIFYTIFQDIKLIDIKEIERRTSSTY